MAVRRQLSRCFAKRQMTSVRLQKQQVSRLTHEEFADFTIAEKALVPLKCCFVSVTRTYASGVTEIDTSKERKLHGNTCCFPSGPLKLTQVSPRPMHCLKIVLHVIRAGNREPTKKDVRHTLRVRRAKVRASVFELR